MDENRVGTQARARVACWKQPGISEAAQLVGLRSETHSVPSRGPQQLRPPQQVQTIEKRERRLVLQRQKPRTESPEQGSEIGTMEAITPLLPRPTLQRQPLQPKMMFLKCLAWEDSCRDAPENLLIKEFLLTSE